MNGGFERREFLKMLVTSGIALTGAAGVMSLVPGCEKKNEIEFEKIYDFLEHLDEAEIVTQKKQHVRQVSFSILKEEKQTLFEHPDSKVTFKEVPIHENARLIFDIGINEPAWEKGGDGVFFEVNLIDEDGQEHHLYAKYIDPKNHPEDRRWFSEVLQLEAFNGQKVHFTFATSSGPKNNRSSDWAGWGEPHVISTARAKEHKIQHTNVILITLDTTRADHLSCYGYHRKTSPHLDLLAQKSTLFMNAVSPSSWTLPAHAALFTSLYPSQHGAVIKKEGDVRSADPLPPYDHILARLLQKNGFHTAGFVGGPYLRSDFGLSQGFLTYDEKWKGFGRPADHINKKVFAWLKDHYQSPFFLFINYFDPHCPYDPTEEVFSHSEEAFVGDVDFSSFCPGHIGRGKVSAPAGQDIARAVDLYDSEIHFMDRHFGELLAKIEALGLLEHTLIIITADHGESFSEHGLWGHGKLPFEDQVHVPLIIHDPGKAVTKKIVTDQVQTNSIYSTILKSQNIPLPPLVLPSGLGINLLKVGEDDENKPPEYTFSEILPSKGYLGMLRTNNWKYLVNRRYRQKGDKIREWIIDMNKDPGEENNLHGQDKKRDETLRTKFAYFSKALAKTETVFSGRPKKSPANLDNDLKEKLKALGYVR